MPPKMQDRVDAPEQRIISVENSLKGSLYEFRLSHKDSPIFSRERGGGGETQKNTKINVTLFTIFTYIF